MVCSFVKTFDEAVFVGAWENVAENVNIQPKGA
jgi:hypothetical protein